MSDVKRREYSSPVRAAQAAANRAAIVRAAHRLFVAQGYAGTTVDQIAAAAGVSKPTVFSSVGNKAEVFKVVRDVAFAGDDDPTPVARRPSVDKARAAPDLAAAVRALAEHMLGLCRRAAEVQEVLRGAASGDPAMRELWATSEDQRLAGAGFFAEILAGKLRPKVSRAKAADALWVIMAPDNYLRLVLVRGWSDRAYRAWLETNIMAQLYGTHP